MLRPWMPQARLGSVRLRMPCPVPPTSVRRFLAAPLPRSSPRWRCPQSTSGDRGQGPRRRSVRGESRMALQTPTPPDPLSTSSAPQRCPRRPRASSRRGTRHGRTPARLLLWRASRWWVLAPRRPGRRCRPCEGCRGTARGTRRTQAAPVEERRHTPRRQSCEPTRP